MNDRHFKNKISLWIKQRLFISRNYDETMSGLEKFASEMKLSDEITTMENEQQKEKSFDDDDDEQRRISSVVPPLAGKSKYCFLFPMKIVS